MSAVYSHKQKKQRQKTSEYKPQKNNKMKTETKTVQICNMEFSIKKTTRTHMDGTKWYCIANAKNNTTIARFKLKRDCEFYFNNFEKLPILPI